MTDQIPYTIETIAKAAELLKLRLETLPEKADILKSLELKVLYAVVPRLAPEDRGAYGKELNQLKQELIQIVQAHQRQFESLPAIDVTAPFDINVTAEQRPRLLNTELGSRHPLMAERDHILDIFNRMGFTASESREIDDDYHMFGALNFPEGHPARDDYDSFMTEQTGPDGKRFIAPAHTSTMQNRLLKQFASDLEKGQPIAVVVPDRVFRNEDLDPRHEHTFYQVEGVYVDKGINSGHLIATLKTFLQEYYQQELDVRTQPFYFPFTEPSFEFNMSCPFCHTQGCSICSYSGWIEILGCGMIHPHVLREADIDPEIYTGFAWGGGIDRLVMMKYGIEDVRHFHAGRLDFLRQFV